MIDKISGIYKITCTVNNKIYIGSSENIRKRKWSHYNDLRKGIHDNRHLQRAWNKYSETVFTFETVEIVEKTLLLETEQVWLDKTKCYDNKIGFNISKKANSTIGIKLPRSAIIKKSKKWIITSPDGNFFRIKNLIRFCKKHGLERSLMGAVAKGKRFQHKGWQCRSANMSFKEWHNSLKIKMWIVTSSDGEEIIVKNLRSFCKNNALSYDGLRKLSYGVPKTNSKGWKCRVIEH